MKRWLALNRWRLLLGLGVVLGLRVVLAIAFAVSAADLVPTAIRVAIVTLWDVAMCILIVIAIAAFVQYGRIYNPRIPTE